MSSKSKSPNVGRVDNQPPEGPRSDLLEMIKSITPAERVAILETLGITDAVIISNLRWEPYKIANALETAGWTDERMWQAFQEAGWIEETAEFDGGNYHTLVQLLKKAGWADLRIIQSLEPRLTKDDDISDIMFALNNPYKAMRESGWDSARICDAWGMNIVIDFLEANDFDDAEIYKELYDLDDAREIRWAFSEAGWKADRIIKAMVGAGATKEEILKVLGWSEDDERLPQLVKETGIDLDALPSKS